MKTIVKYILVFCLITLSFSAISQNYGRVDAIVKNYPAKFRKAELLAKKINEDFNTQAEKARAIYSWIAFNIEYDVALMGKQKPTRFFYTSEADLLSQKTKHLIKKANTTIRKGSGVCEHYATLYAVTAFYCGLDSYIIGGKANNGENIEGHAWNSVKIGNKWYLIDATWGAGYIDEGVFVQKFKPHFFMANPEQFSKTHTPIFERWKLAEN